MRQQLQSIGCKTLPAGTRHKPSKALKRAPVSRKARLTNEEIEYEIHLGLQGR